MDTRGKQRDGHPTPRPAEVTTDTGSVQIVELGTVGPPPRSPRSTAFLVAGVAVALAFGGVVALNRPAPAPTSTPGSTSPVAIETATSTPSARPSASPRPAPTARPRPTSGPWVWDLYDLGGFAPASVVRRIWAVDNRFVALLSTPVDDSEDAEQIDSLLLSTDGAAWTRAVLPAPGFRVHHATLTDGALVLIGTSTDGTAPALQAWATANGISWGREEGLESMLVGFDVVLAIALGQPGWVAVGWTIATDNEEPRREVRYDVDDDGHWAAADVLLGPSDDVAGLVTNVTSFILAIEHKSDQSDGNVELSHSFDGAAWISVADLPAGSRPGGLTVRDGVYVLVGEDRSPDDDTVRPIAYRSADGVLWDEGTMPVGLPPPGLSIVAPHRVVPTSQGYLAISEANGMAWISPDGLSWKARNVWPTVYEFMRDVAVVGDVVVALRGDPGRLGFLRGSVNSMR